MEQGKGEIILIENNQTFTSSETVDIVDTYLKVKPDKKFIMLL